MKFDEAQVIATVAEIFRSDSAGVLVGIGDDGAVVKTSPLSAVSYTHLTLPTIYSV